MDGAGIRIIWRLTGRRILTANGYTPIADGPGFRICRGGGHAFIMERGISMTLTDGFGVREQSGRLRGWYGDAGTAGLAGHLVRGDSDGVKVSALT